MKKESVYTEDIKAEWDFYLGEYCTNQTFIKPSDIGIVERTESRFEEAIGKGSTFLALASIRNGIDILSMLMNGSDTSEGDRVSAINGIRTLITFWRGRDATLFFMGVK